MKLHYITSLLLLFAGMGGVNAQTNIALEATTVTVDGASKTVFNLPTGYYTMQCADVSRGYLFNDYNHEGNSTHLTLQTTTRPDYNTGYWHIVNNNDGTVKITNGDGNGVKANNANNGNPYTILNLGEYVSTYSGIYFTEALNASAIRNDNYDGPKLADGTHYLGIWTGHPSASDNQWNFAPVDATHIYDVVISAPSGMAADQAWVKQNVEGAGATLNGGFFISSTALTSDNFTVNELDKYDYTINVTEGTDGEHGSVTVTYEKSITKILAKMEADLACGGKVGYPDANATKIFSDAITAYKERDITEEKLNTAYTTFLSSADVVLPEDGKVYTFKFVTSGTSEYYMYYTDAGVLENTTDKELAAKFICHKVEGGKYVFINSNGHFLQTRYGGTGHKDTYDEYTTSFTVERSSDYYTEGSDPTRITAVATAEKMFGVLSIYSERRYNGTGSNNAYFIIAENGDWSISNAPFFNGSYTTAIVMEEVEGAYNVAENTATLRLPRTPDAQNHSYGTYYASEPKALKDGVRAFYCSAVTDGRMVMTELPERVIPGRTAVLLEGTIQLEGEDSDKKAVIDMPFATNTQTVTGNKFMSAAEAETAKGADGKIYALSGAYGSIGFYPLALAEGKTIDVCRAYYVPETPVQQPGGEGNVRGYLFNMGGDDTPDAITAAPVQAQTEAEVYDLSGRRVQRATRGIFIVNGKKIVK